MSRRPNCPHGITAIHAKVDLWNLVGVWPAVLTQNRDDGMRCSGELPHKIVTHMDFRNKPFPKECFEGTPEERKALAKVFSLYYAMEYPESVSAETGAVMLDISGMLNWQSVAKIDGCPLIIICFLKRIFLNAGHCRATNGFADTGCCLSVGSINNSS